MAFPKYQTKEVLNKVLNSGENALQVDIISSSEHAEDDAHTSGDTGTFILGVRQDSIAALGADGDYVPFQVNASGALYVEITTGGSSDAVHVDDAAFTLGSHKGMMMMGFAGTQSVNANDAGAIAMETDGSIHIHDGGNTITVDGTVTANLGTTDNAVLDAMAASLALLDNSIASGNELQVDVVGALPAGSAAIGKLAANSGVDIGDVDVTSIVPGTGATNLGKAEDAAHSDGDTGVMALAVRNDDVAALSGADGDYSPLQVNAAGSLYTKDETGEAGSILVTGTTAVTTTVTANTAFVAIQFIEDSVFDSGNDGLVSSTNQLYPSTQYTSTSIDADGGAVADSVTFPQGLTIFGRWSGFKLASGKVIAYIAHV